MLLGHTFIFLNSWVDHFPDTTSNYSVSSGSFRLTPTPGDRVHVSNCFLNGFSDEADGGALYFSTSNSNSKLLVEYSSITNCSCSGRGGAIYYGNQGSCIFSMVCGTMCTSYNSYGKFNYVWATDNTANPNYIKESSICSCISDSSYSIVDQYRGNGLVNSVNISSNQCPDVSGFHYSSATGKTFSMKFSTISGNNATANRCMWFHNSGIFDIEFANILFNVQPSSASMGLIYSQGNIVLKECCIMGNEGKSIYHNAGSLSFLIDNCTIDSSSITKKLDIFRSQISFLYRLFILLIILLLIHAKIKITILHHYPYLRQDA